METSSLTQLFDVSMNEATNTSQLQTPANNNYSTLKHAETVGSDISHAVIVVAYSSLRTVLMISTYFHIFPRVPVCFQVVAYSSVIVMSIAGNGIVIVSVITCRRMRSVTNYFIVSLAGADLVMAVLCSWPREQLEDWRQGQKEFSKKSWTSRCEVVVWPRGQHCN